MNIDTEILSKILELYPAIYFAQIGFRSESSVWLNIAK